MPTIEAWVRGSRDKGSFQSRHSGSEDRGVASVMFPTLCLSVSEAVEISHSPKRKLGPDIVPSGVPSSSLTFSINSRVPITFAYTHTR